MTETLKKTCVASGEHRLFLPFVNSDCEGLTGRVVIVYSDLLGQSPSFPRGRPWRLELVFGKRSALCDPRSRKSEDGRDVSNASARYAADQRQRPSGNECGRTNVSRPSGRSLWAFKTTNGGGTACFSSTKGGGAKPDASDSTLLRVEIVI